MKYIICFQIKELEGALDSKRRHEEWIEEQQKALFNQIEIVLNKYEALQSESECCRSLMTAFGAGVFAIAEKLEMKAVSRNLGESLKMNGNRSLLEAMAQKAAEYINQRAMAKENVKSEQWSCFNCTYDNDADATHCDMCKKPRSNATSQILAIQDLDGDQTMEAKVGETVDEINQNMPKQQNVQIPMPKTQEIIVLTDDDEEVNPQTVRDLRLKANLETLMGVRKVMVPVDGAKLKGGNGGQKGAEKVGNVKKPGLMEKKKQQHISRMRSKHEKQ